MLLVLLLFRVTEARVFCEDSNAMAWRVNGYSCPVMCASVQNAIKRLIMLDYKKTVQEQLGKKNIDTDMLNELHYDDMIKRKGYKQTVKNNKRTDILKQLNNEIIEKIHNAKDILRSEIGSTNGANVGTNPQDVSTNTTDVGHKCWYLDRFKPSILIGKIVRRSCTRRSNFDGKFLTIMTNILNKYVDSNLQFTEEMTEILLENIFGQNTDLRNNIFDVNKLLKYLRKSVDLHKTHSQVITLKSRNCLTLAAPGCYCKPGFVESSGQCVKPSDCISDSKYYKYLKRIIVI